jgi:hypothetical protein
MQKIDKIDYRLKNNRNTITFAIAVAKPGVSKWGLRGKVYGMGVPLPAGGPGAQPPENFQITDACRSVLVHFFRQKSTH